MVSDNPLKGRFLLLVLIGLGVTLPSFAWNRIVTLNPMITEWSAQILGKEKALKTIVGASEYSNYPDYMGAVNSVGPYPQIQIEKVVALQPDLVIASSEYNRGDQIEQLKKLKMNVQVLPKEKFSDMEKWIVDLGFTLGESGSAKKLAAEWKKDLAAIRPGKTKRAFFQIQFQPLVTVGRESFLNEAFKLAGIQNIFESIPQAYPKVSKEAVYSKKPDIVLVFEMVKRQEDLETIGLTWKNSLIQVLNGDDFSRCSPRLLKALKEVQ